ncbi:hypothetical protein K2173_001678 [Erythroxylum novogranatense]|uniref:Glutamate receptor n=1 Tax=Erythroxylum novogranatense TaxID=1862640 RepID=A0AAV8T5S3_9ROSI|nr:hypothetical protein K2173_001678 [Erythroxylum novogranatense]
MYKEMNAAWSKVQLSPYLFSVYTVKKSWFLMCLLIITILLFFSNGIEGSSRSKKVTDIGAIIDINCLSGKEAKTAMKIAVQNFNSGSKRHQLSLHFKHSSGDPLQAADAAEGLIKEMNVKVLIVMRTWDEAALVADIGNRAEIPILSFTAPAITPPLVSVRWPFLIRMASDASQTMKCIAALVHSYSWKRVVVIYEDDMLGGESGKLALLSEALRDVGSEIEYRLALPPISFLSKPEDVIQEELIKVLKTIQCRVFVVLQSSFPMVAHLFERANKLGLAGKDTSWIVANSIADSLDTFEASVISSMEGTLGLKTYYPSNTAYYRSFKEKFRRVFRLEHPDEDGFVPGVEALKAYDSITIISQAIERLNGNTSVPKMLLKILSYGNFTGLSGQIHLEAGQLSHAPMVIVNVVGKKYKELGFWLPNNGFSDTLTALKGRETLRSEDGSGPVIWPGNLRERDPKGWAMPNEKEPMKIIVPSRTSFEKFVSFPSGGKRPVGFCIELFYEVLKILNYSLPHQFEPHDGPYDEMIQYVYEKQYDAAVGDITILAERTKYVEFTQPYLESGLSMIVPAEPDDSMWLFVKPFKLKLWITTGAIFIYTSIVVWFLERQNNPASPRVKGSWKTQIGTSIWFTFSSLFFAHRENINSKLGRVVVASWLCVVFILTSSYSAGLTSMLTVKRMNPHFSYVDDLRRDKLYVGCDNDSFVKNYLEKVIDLDPNRIRVLDNIKNYTDEFEKHNLAAAFLELPYEKVFLNQYCKSYASTGATYRFGGFSFAFQKGSPIATDFSKAILKLLENGRLNELNDIWFAPSSECSNNGRDDNDVESLTLRSFWGVYVSYGVISLICIFVVVFQLKYKGQAKDNNNSNPSQEVEMMNYFGNGERNNSPGRMLPGFARKRSMEPRNSAKWESVSTSDTAA